MNILLRERLILELEATDRRIKEGREYVAVPGAQEGPGEQRNKRPITRQVGGPEASPAKPPAAVVTPAVALDTPAPRSDRASLPAAVPDPRLTDLVAALAEAAPAPVKSVLPLVTFAFPIHGTRVDSTLQRRGDVPDRFGLSVEITELDGPPEPRPWTFWEPPVKEARAASAGVVVPDIMDRTDTVRRIAARLADASRFAEALEYMRLASERHPSDPALRTELADMLAVLRSQSEARAAYGVAEALRESGLVEESIDRYVEVLPRPARAAARKDWRVALKVDRGERAEALESLSTQYLARPQALLDEALSLAEEAAAAGSPRAAKAALKLRSETATALADAADGLVLLGRLKNAQRLVAGALQYDAAHEAAIAIKEKLSQADELSTEAEALARIGAIYEARSAWSNARKKYEEALQKDPELADAREGLRRAMTKSVGTLDQLEPLIVRAAKWIAFTIAESRMQRDAQDQRMGPADRARIHNFFGALYQAQGWGGREDWYTLAQGEFRRAIDLAPDWFQPYASLGDVYTLIGRMKGTEAGQAAQYAAIAQFDLAISKATSPAEIRRIDIKRATAQILTGEDVEREQAARAIEAVGQELEDAAADWGTLYDLGSLHVLAASHGVPGASADRGKALLTQALFVNRALWNAAIRDPDLESIRDELPRLRVAAANLALPVSARIEPVPEPPVEAAIAAPVPVDAVPLGMEAHDDGQAEQPTGTNREREEKGDGGRAD